MPHPVDVLEERLKVFGSRMRSSFKSLGAAARQEQAQRKAQNDAELDDLQQQFAEFARGLDNNGNGSGDDDLSSNGFDSVFDCNDDSSQSSGLLGRLPRSDSGSGAGGGGNGRGEGAGVRSSSSAAGLAGLGGSSSSFGGGSSGGSAGGRVSSAVLDAAPSDEVGIGTAGGGEQRMAIGAERMAASDGGDGGVGEEVVEADVECLPWEVHAAFADAAAAFGEDRYLAAYQAVSAVAREHSLSARQVEAMCLLVGGGCSGDGSGSNGGDGGSGGSDGGGGGVGDGVDGGGGNRVGGSGADALRGPAAVAAGVARVADDGMEGGTESSTRQQQQQEPQQQLDGRCPGEGNSAGQGAAAAAADADRGAGMAASKPLGSRQTAADRVAGTASGGGETALPQYNGGQPEQQQGEKQGEDGEETFGWQLLRQRVALLRKCLGDLASDDGWSHAARGGLRVMYRREPGASIHSYRFQTIFSTPAPHLLALCQEFDLFPSWNSTCLDAVVLSHRSPSCLLCYVRQAQPPPFQHLGIVFEAVGIDLLDEDGSVVIALQSPENLPPEAAAQLPAEYKSGKLTRMRMLPGSCLRVKPLPPAAKAPAPAPGGRRQQQQQQQQQYRTYGQAMFHLDPQGAVMPPALVRFILRIMAPLVHRQVNKTLEHVFTDKEAALPRRMRQRSKYYAHMKGRMASRMLQPDKCTAT